MQGDCGVGARGARSARACKGRKHLWTGRSQFAEGFSTRTMTMTSTGAVAASSRSPSCSCIAVNRFGGAFGLSAGGGTLTDTLHIVWPVATGLLMTVAIGFAAAALDKRFRVYSVITLVVLVTFGALTGMEAPKLEANLSTPWMVPRKTLLESRRVPSRVCRVLHRPRSKTGFYLRCRVRNIPGMQTAPAVAQASKLGLFSWLTRPQFMFRRSLSSSALRSSMYS